MEMNNNLDAGRCFVSFSYGTDKIFVFEHPDENVGCYIGWIITINTVPYFWSLAGGSEMLDTAVANTYAQYLAENKEFDYLEKAMGEDDVWVLNDDTSIDFYSTWVDAMHDANYCRRKDGGWKYKTKKFKKRA